MVASFDDDGWGIACANLAVLAPELAAEVQRLTAENEALQTRLQFAYNKKNELAAEGADHRREIERLTAENAALRAALDDAEGDDAMDDLDMLALLRKQGWRVAVHNDYRQHGMDCTFWLLTHPSGRWVKGEGVSDALALDQALRAVSQAQRVGVTEAMEAALEDARYKADYWKRMHDEVRATLTAALPEVAPDWVRIENEARAKDGRTLHPGPIPRSAYTNNPYADD
jgi:hypothetical protein